MLKLLWGSHTGMKRSTNQDSVGGRADVLAYGFVCDGMGGHSGGETAAEIAKATLNRAFDSRMGKAMEERAIRNLMESAVKTANAEILSCATDNPALQGMGATLVLAVVQGDMAMLCHLGDSRIYLIRGQELTQLTKDHSLVQELLDKGKITPAQAETHPERHYITRALGVADSISPQWGDTQFLSGDILLLCSDGLHNMVPQEELCGLCHMAVQSGDASCLIDKANEYGGADNVTALLICNDAKNHSII